MSQLGETRDEMREISHGHLAENLQGWVQIWVQRSDKQEEVLKNLTGDWPGKSLRLRKKKLPGLLKTVKTEVLHKFGAWIVMCHIEQWPLKDPWS